MRVTGSGFTPRAPRLDLSRVAVSQRCDHASSDGHDQRHAAIPGSHDRWDVQRPLVCQQREEHQDSHERPRQRAAVDLAGQCRQRRRKPGPPALRLLVRSIRRPTTQPTSPAQFRLPDGRWTIPASLQVQLWRNCVEAIDRPAGACSAATPGGPANFVFVANASFLAGARSDVETSNHGESAVLPRGVGLLDVHQRAAAPATRHRAGRTGNIHAVGVRGERRQSSHAARNEDDHAGQRYGNAPLRRD